jgi:lipoprotein-releasing system permease protein
VTPPLYIALRFLAHRKRAFLLSLGGVVFGVAIFICTQAQTQGFSNHFIESTIGSNGSLMLRSRFQPLGEGLPVPPKKTAYHRRAALQRRYIEGIPNAGEIMRVSRQFPNVVACSPVLRGTLSARSGFENATVDLFGIDPALHLQTTDLGKQIIAGKFQDFRDNPTSVIVGSRLAQELNLAEGDSVQLLAPGGEYWRFTVAGIARSGVGAVDAARIYAHAKISQTLLHKPYSASMIIYKLRDPDRAPSLSKQFETLFQHSSQSWQEREAGNLQLFLTLRVSAAITVSLIILLAGFGIFNVLTMSVLSKVKEIAILRSMGYRRNDISAIFLWQGALIAGAGGILGCSAGALLTWGVSHIPIKVRGLLTTDHFLVAWDWRHYFWGSVLAAIAVLIASYVPARRAALLPPVATLRGSSV